MEGSWEYIE